MNEPSKQTSFRRLVLEGSVIVLSILLAFSIDAWWEERKVENSQIEQLVRVAAELRLNAQRIQSKIENIEIAISATSEFLSGMGPQPQEIQPQVFHNHWEAMISIGTFSLVRRAAEDFLAGGNIDISGYPEIRYSLAEWYSYGDNLEKQYDILRGEHAKLIDYNNAKPAAPALYVLSDLEVMQSHPKSNFPYDQSEVLADPAVESFLAVYLIRLEFVVRQAIDYQERQERLLTAINSIGGE